MFFFGTPTANCRNLGRNHESLSYKSRSSLLRLFVLFLLSMLWRSWLRLFLLFFLHPRGIRRSRSGCHCSAVKVGWCCCFLRSLKSLLPAEMLKEWRTPRNLWKFCCHVLCHLLFLVLEATSSNALCLNFRMPANNMASTAIQSLRPACELLPDASARFLCSSPFKPVKLCESSRKKRDQCKPKTKRRLFPKQSTKLNKGKVRSFSSVFFASRDAEVPLAFPKACDQTIQWVLYRFG